ncbi:MAG: hypothetical protein LBC43_02070, partial [Bifidobacteriaceae bacterium]|nr:hypothetical protein [Bifidobacteriaceae bacterium]
MPQIIPITPRGFCQGVVRAIKLLENQTTQSKVPVSDPSAKVFALNEIVHNQSVVQKFRNQGVRFISFDQV